MPPAEWIAARQAAGLETDVVWKLEKQMPGRRAAGNRWHNHLAAKFGECGLVQNEGMPNFFKIPDTRVVIDTHMDDFHGVARRSEAEKLLPMLHEKLKMKSSDLCIVGDYSYLRRTRIKKDTGTFIATNPKHAQGVITALGVEGASPVSTPYLTEPDPTIGKAS